MYVCVCVCVCVCVYIYKILPVVTTWMDFEVIMPSEMSYKER